MGKLWIAKMDSGNGMWKKEGSGEFELVGIVGREEEVFGRCGSEVEEVVLVEDGFCGEGCGTCRENELDGRAESLLDEGGKKRIVGASEEGCIDVVGTEVTEIVFDDELSGWVGMEIFFDERDEERAWNGKDLEGWVVR